MHTGRSPCLTFPVSELQQSRCSAGDVRGDHGGVHSRVENEADGKGDSVHQHSPATRQGQCSKTEFRRRASANHMVTTIRSIAMPTRHAFLGISGELADTRCLHAMSNPRIDHVQRLSRSVELSTGSIPGWVTGARKNSKAG